MVIDDRRQPAERGVWHRVMPALSAGFGEQIKVGFLNFVTVCAVAHPWQRRVLMNLTPPLLSGIPCAESTWQGRLRERFPSKMPSQRSRGCDQNGTLHTILLFRVRLYNDI